MIRDSIGDRMKAYERAYHYSISQNSWVIIRVDGKAFHSIKFDKPFDQNMIDCMLLAAQNTAKQIQGFKLGYVQSDEASFLLTDTDTHDTQMWFGGDIAKMISISAAYMTAYFNSAYQPGYWHAFDSRAFLIPKEDSLNCFIWRQRDWERNSINMYAQSFFSHKQLHKKSCSEIHEMLHSIGKNWTTDLTNQQKNGTLFTKNKTFNNKFDYKFLEELLATTAQTEVEKLIRGENK